MNSPTAMKIPSLKSFLTLLACALVPLSLWGQAANTPAAPSNNELGNAAASPAADQVVQMPAFDVSEQNQGYIARQTLSGTRTTADVMNLGQTINIANQQLITDLGATTAIEALSYVSGGLVRRSFNAGDDTFIWGFLLGQRHVKDGFVDTTNSVGTLYDVDRVEVIKGPGAMIYGQVSFIGGIINYVSRVPTSTLYASLQVSYGSFDDRRAGALHLSGPITKNCFTGRISALTRTGARGCSAFTAISLRRWHRIRFQRQGEAARRCGAHGHGLQLR